MNWWPIAAHEQGNNTCHRCGSRGGLSIDDQGNVYCAAHRHLHGQAS